MGLSQRQNVERCSPKWRRVGVAPGFPLSERLGDSRVCQSSTLRRNFAFADSGFAPPPSSFFNPPKIVATCVGHPILPFTAVPPANVLSLTHSSMGRVSYFFLRLDTREGHLEQRDMTDAGGLLPRRRAVGRETILQ